MANVSYPGVYVEETASGVRPIQTASTSTAAFIGKAERGPAKQAIRIYNFTEFQNHFGGFLSDSFLAHSVYQFFSNGGAQCYIVRALASDARTAHVTIDNRAASPTPALRIEAASPGAWASGLRLRITNGNNFPESEFNLYLHRAGVETPIESYENLSLSRNAPNFAERAIKSSRYIRLRLEAPDASAEDPESRPANNTTQQPFYDLDADQTGGDGAALQDLDYIACLSALDAIDDVSLIAAPGLGSPAIVSAALAYCANRPLSDCFFLADLPEDKAPVEQAKLYMAALTPKNSYGALYTPWIRTLDPRSRSGETVLIPPSGFMAGLYARTDSRRGVWKAPAGTAAALANALGLQSAYTDLEQGNLNPRNINCIRSFGGSGTVPWGARTISSDPEYGYVPVRRTAIMIRVSIYAGLQWAVFEPNDEELWSQIRLNINSFMMTLYRRGAFQGATPSQAFFVKCDSETTSQDDIDRGVVNVSVGFAPLKPAEFIVVQISQMAGKR